MATGLGGGSLAPPGRPGKSGLQLGGEHYMLDACGTTTTVYSRTVAYSVPYCTVPVFSILVSQYSYMYIVPVRYILLLPYTVYVVCIKQRNTVLSELLYSYSSELVVVREIGGVVARGRRRR